MTAAQSVSWADCCHTQVPIKAEVFSKISFVNQDLSSTDLVDHASNAKCGSWLHHAHWWNLHVQKRGLMYSKFSFNHYQYITEKPSRAKPKNQNSNNNNCNNKTNSPKRSNNSTEMSFKNLSLFPCYIQFYQMDNTFSHRTEQKFSIIFSPSRSMYILCKKW